MYLENKRQNEISQIDGYLCVKSKQSNSSRGHSRYSRAWGKAKGEAEARGYTMQLHNTALYTRNFLRR